MSKLDVIEALLAEGMRKNLTANRKYISTAERTAIAKDSAAIAIAVLIDLTDGHDHIVRAEGDTFTLQHPLIERLNGDDLFSCDVHAHLASGEPLERGRYRVVATDSHDFELIPVKDQP
ncbi:hypothetical protein CQ047_11265 [Microbacterium sp. MYb72]|uniref:DUF6085 family protein n=1 Tax=Microbacterium sp. MYb72 TaxID=1848693 RepID=UPI000CFB7E4D|nr:DUF6085 family protein [Microbacterium sp. MYb72]PRB09250.1 hypothetical protein CQ047_11265 [Microbacterium sp. MYb72]